MTHAPGDSRSVQCDTCNERSSEKEAVHANRKY